MRTIRYGDGRWCEQQYVGDQLHGTWTVYRANGAKEWERQHADGRKEGYYRKWDTVGRLVEEQWYHLDELHGPWRTWNETGEEELVGDFAFGYPRRAFEATRNPEFNRLIKPLYGLEPAEFAGRLDALVPAWRHETVAMKKLPLAPGALAGRGSFWNHVNVSKAGEAWPSFEGVPLFPILQINCDDIRLADHPLAGLSFVTIFAASGSALSSRGGDLVVRAYRDGDELVRIEPPCDPLDPPSRLDLSDVAVSFPDENDLPPGFKAALKGSAWADRVPGSEGGLASRLGGWPGWVQSGRLSRFGRFAFQLDSLDIEHWACGDCTVHYFFVDDDRELGWTQEMC